MAQNNATQGTPDAPHDGQRNPKEKKPNNVGQTRFKRKVGLAIAAGLIALGLVVGYPLYLHFISHESTDDAFINGRIVPVSPRVSGHVAKVYVDDNQHVAAGDLLLELDPRDFQAHVDADQAMVQNAQAAVDAARSHKAEVRVQVAVATAALEQAQAEQIAAEAKYGQSAADLKRYRELAASNTISPQQLDHAATAARMAAADRDAARSKVTTQRTRIEQAEAALTMAEDSVRQALAQVAARKSQLEQSTLRLSYTRILATGDGYVTKKSVEPGTFVQVGQALMAVVSTQVWVTANFKETQLTHMQPGQPVVIAVDTFPGVTFHGRVESIQRGTGSRFSLLPPENATGNFVKVVQRIPVKIVFDQPDELAGYLLVPGMSVVPEVAVKEKSGVLPVNAQVSSAVTQQVKQ